MTAAPERGDSAHPERERAPRRQPGSPISLSISSSGHSAYHSKDQAQNTIRVHAAEPGHRPITNGGLAKKCIKMVGKIIREDYGRSGCRGPEQRDFFIAVASLEDTAASADPRYQRSLAQFTRRHLPGFGEASQADALAELRGHPIEMTPRILGELLTLTDARRDRFKFWLAEAVDMSAEARAEKHRRKEAERLRRWREKNGAVPRSQCFARILELQPGVSTATGYRHRALKRGA